jgi:hypothetical protein
MLVVGLGWFPQVCDLLDDGSGAHPQGHPGQKLRFELETCDAIALAEATPVAAAEPSALTDAVL